jgi:hypothetical protein
MNESGTCEKIDTPLTQAGSLNVLRDLLVKRRRVGPESREGRLLSNLIQQIRNYQREEDPVARANLERFMGWQVQLLAKH